MTNPPLICAVCGASVSADAQTCPRCRTALPKPAARAAPRAGSGAAGLADVAPSVGPAAGRMPPAPKGMSAHLTQRYVRLMNWQEKARTLQVSFPPLPEWAQGAASVKEEDRWEAMVQGLERVAYKEISQALEAWTKEARGRLNRLEAYGLGTPEDRKHLENLALATRTGDLERSLDLYVVLADDLSAKERGLDTARDALEALSLLSADLRAVGLHVPWEDGSTLARLETALKDGKAAATLEEARGLRERAVNVLTVELPAQVLRAADRTAQEKGEGKDVAQAALLVARAARALRTGKPEEALRNLVRYQSHKVLDPFALAEGQARGDVP